MRTVTLFPALHGGLPPKLSRADMLRTKCVFQGMSFVTRQYGSFPGDGGELNMLDQVQDRLDYYKVLHSVGTTAPMLIWASDTYSEPDFTSPVPGPQMRWVKDVKGFCDRIAEILTVGGFSAVYIPLPGDGQTAPDYPYGWQFTMDNVASLVAAMKAYPLGDLTPYCIFGSGFDGVVWNWTEDQVVQYGQYLRTLMPDAVLAMEFGAGIVGPWGEGKEQYPDASQWASNPKMALFDLFLQEFASPPYSNLDQIWQIVARLAAPDYVRPPDQPTDDDPQSPFRPGSGNDLLSNGTPRGPYGYWLFEGDTYEWVRGRVNLTDCIAHGRYIQAAAPNHICCWPT